MKKLTVLLFLVVLACIFFVCTIGAACGEEPAAPTNTAEQTKTDDNGSGSGTGDETDDNGSETNLLNFSGINFQSAIYDYDGTEKTILVSGTLPTGTTVNYTNNSKVDAGTYSASATLKCNGYNDLTLTATLKINKLNITGLTLNDDTVEYDALAHSLEIIGNPPNGTTVLYSYNNQITDSVTDVGTYNVKAMISCKNYNDLILNATLIIKTTEKQLFSAVVGNKVYFQNALDGDKLYLANSNGTLTKINNDVPNYMTVYGENVYYISRSLLSATIKSVNGATVTDLYKVPYTAKNLTTDGTYLYYSTGLPLISGNSDGIYRLSVDGNSNQPEKIVSDKTDAIVYYNAKLFYINSNDGKCLYSVSASATNTTGTKITEHKTLSLTEDNGYLYFTATNTISGVTGDIYKYNISTKSETKLTNVSGKALTKINGYIFYLNNDLISSELFGDGIYKVSVSGSIVGTKVLSAENDGFSSLSGDGTYLYYYRLNDKHLYRYNESTDTETDLMQNFIPVDDTTLSGYSVLAEYNGEIYYTNPRDESCLYKYNPVTKAKFKVLSDHTSNVYFNDGYMYYSAYILTNYAFYKTNLTTNETEKIYSGRVENVIFDNNAIYFVKIGVAQTYTNYIMKMNLDGTDVTELYKGKNLNVTGFAKSDGKIYFTINPAIGYKYIYVYDINAGTAESLDIKSSNLIIANDKIYYYDHTNNSLKTCDLSGNSVTTIKISVEINDLYTDGSLVYFSSVSSANTGIYRVTANGTTTKISDYAGHGFVSVNDNLFFLQSAISYTNDYPSQNSSYNGNLYCFNGTTTVKVA